MRALLGTCLAVVAFVVVGLAIASSADAAQSTRPRLSAPPAGASTVDGGTSYAGCAGAGFSGSVCKSGGATTPLTIDAGVVFTTAGAAITVTDNTAAHIVIQGPGASQVITMDSSTYGIIIQMDPTHAIYVDTGSTQIVGPLKATDAANKGTLTMSGGTATATVASGAICTCAYKSTGAHTLVPDCAVSSTTLTINADDTKLVNYTCL